MSGLATASASADVEGAGSSLVAPLMANWINGFEIRTGIKATYASVGSGTGIKQITARTVDFGASDAPMTPEQAAACNNCVHIPWALTATGIGFNVPGVKTLNLTGPILTQIYLGNIKKWNDPKIKKINKQAHLPNMPITPVYRSDGSGDTYAFTEYLSHVSNYWKKHVGFATSVGFPEGVGAKGNSGVTATVKATKGGIGYISASYLIAAGLGAAALQNKAGNYELPNLKNIQSAAGYLKKLSKHNTASIVDPPKKQKIAYPLSTFTYAIIPHDGSNLAETKTFAKYAVTVGQKYGAALDFAPLPKFVKKAALRAINSL